VTRGNLTVTTPNFLGPCAVADQASTKRFFAYWLGCDPKMRCWNWGIRLRTAPRLNDLPVLVPIKVLVALAREQFCRSELAVALASHAADDECPMGRIPSWKCF